MRLYPLLAAAAALAVAASPAAAQNRRAAPRGGESTALAQQVSQGQQQPDVLLDVPDLSVEEIKLEVDNLQVHIALDARLTNLLKLTAGADAAIDKVKLDIKGVHAKATLIVRLENVRAIIERTLQTLDNHSVPSLTVDAILLVQASPTTRSARGLGNIALHRASDGAGVRPRPLGPHRRFPDGQHRGPDGANGARQQRPIARGGDRRRRQNRLVPAGDATALR